MSNKIFHANGNGFIGGNALCKGKGDVVANDEIVNCEDCMKIMIKYSLVKGWSLTPNLAAEQAKKNYTIEKV